MKDVILGIDGVIGTGKTSLCQELQEKGHNVIFEDMSKNPYIKPSYEDPKNWAFKSQMWILENKEIPKSSAILDRTQYGDWAFALMHHNKGYISDYQLGEYVEKFNKINQKVSSIIYLIEDPIVVCRRIKRRRVPYEKNLTVADIMELMKWYKKSMEKISKILDVYVIKWPDKKSPEYKEAEDLVYGTIDKLFK